MTRDELENMLSEMEADAEFFINRAEDDHVVDEKHFKIKKLITMLREALKCIEEKDLILSSIKAQCNGGGRVFIKYKCVDALALKPGFLKRGKK